MGTRAHMESLELDQETGSSPDDVIEVPIETVLAADSPRLTGEDLAHVRVLAEGVGVLPPIIVHRSTMRVIDGMHRLRAAKVRGRRSIAVRFFDGDEHAAFILGVKANIAHGLPLTLADRKAAAARILVLYPHWSDRAIAAIAGLAHKTVGAVRRRSSGEVPQLTGRVGRDGRVRPLNSADGRRRAIELLMDDPDASVHDIARAAGVSRTTAKDVRRRLHDGADESADAARVVESVPVVDGSSALRALRSDPSLRFTETGKMLLRALSHCPGTAAECDELADGVPSHCVTSVAELARMYADYWHRLAARLEERSCE